MSDNNDYESQRQSADFFGNLLSDLENIEEGKAVPTRLADGSTFINDFTQINIAETKNLLHSLTDSGIVEYGNLYNESEANLYDQNAFLYEDTDNEINSIYGNYIPEDGEVFIPDENYTPPPRKVQNNQTYTQNQPVPQNRPFVPGKYWTLTEENVFGMKTAKVYSIKHSQTNQVIMNNIMMYESAQALVNILNQGGTLTDPKVLGIISSGLQYTSVVTEAINAAKERQQVLKESKYDKAQSLDVVIAEHKLKASQLKQKVLNFLYEEGFITK